MSRPPNESLGALPTTAGLLRLHPAPGSHRAAVRAGVSVGVPLLACVLLDRPEWTLYAAFGAFASLYGRHDVHRARALMQTSAGLALTAAVFAGALVADAGGDAWLLIAGAVVAAVVGQLLSEWQTWHPPGPIFLCFAFGAVASVPPVHSTLLIPLGVAGGSALFAVVIGAVGSLARGQRSRRTRPAPRWSLQPVRHGVAVLLAGLLAVASPLGHPYWAMVAAVAALAAGDLASRVTRSWHRALGTLAGLLPAAALLALHLGPVATVVVVIALQVITEMVIGRNYGLALLFITPMALLVGQIAGERPVQDLILDRGLETLIGSGVALAMIVAEQRISRGRRTT